MPSPPNCVIPKARVLSSGPRDLPQINFVFPAGFLPTQKNAGRNIGRLAWCPIIFAASPRAFHRKLQPDRLGHRDQRREPRVPPRR
jgi:hypothetical protein